MDINKHLSPFELKHFLHLFSYLVFVHVLHILSYLITWDIKNQSSSTCMEKEKWFTFSVFPIQLSSVICLITTFLGYQFYLVVLTGKFKLLLGFGLLCEIRESRTLWLG